MKRPLALLAGTLTLTLLCACTAPSTPMPSPASTPSPSPSPAPLTFTRETFPRLDGSTSTVPLGEAVAAALLGESREAVGDLVQFSKTSEAYYHLMAGEADLLIVGEPGASVLEEKERLGFQWDSAPFANDGFVFVVNEDNPVESLSVAQLRDIYTGQITNWSQVGGEDREIVPFQRNEEAGSQILMKKLVMGDTKLMEPPTEYLVATMGQLIEAVKSYDGSPGAIGYTVYYYADEMKMATGLKLLSISGVAPNPDTIRGEEYPLLNPKYVVIPADREENDPARQVYNWLLSPQGQALVEAEGYIPKQSGNLAPVGGRWYPDYTPDLISRDDYGRLIPYAGLRLLDRWPAVSGCLYGLMTQDGKVVVDPVYSNAVWVGSYNAGSERMERIPILALTQGNLEAPERTEDPRKLRFAAADGSWVTGPDYGLYCVSGDKLMAATVDALVVLDINGAEVRRWTFAALGYAAGETPGWKAGPHDNYLSWTDGMVLLESHPEVRFLNTETGRVVTMPPVESSMGAFSEGLAWAHDPAAGLTGYLDKEGNWAIAPQFTMAGDFQGGKALAYLWNDAKTIDISGKILGKYRDEARPQENVLLDALTGEAVQWGTGGPPEAYTKAAAEEYDSNRPWYRSVAVVGGLVEVLDLNLASYYDLDGKCVFRCHLGYEGD